MTQRIRRSLRLSAISTQIGQTSRRPGAHGRLFLVLAALLLSAVLAPEHATAVCTPDPPMEGDSVTCTDEVSDGYDVSDADDLTIMIEGNSVFDDSGTMPVADSAIRIGDETQILIGEDSIINVTETDGNGIRGDDNNFIDNGGTININGVGGRGIKIENNTTGILPNGAVNGETGSIFANSDDSVAMETGANSGVATSGLIELVGENTRGVSAGSREDLSAAANISNLGTINVGGDGGFGIIAGDDWIDGLALRGAFLPQAAGIRNFQDPFRGEGGEINVTGANSFGIFAGDTSNTTGENNSFVVNGDNAVITVTGTDSIGVSIGGNGYLRSVEPLFDSLSTFQNSGTITGGPNAGPLVEIRSFFGDFENRIFNAAAGEISADPTNLGTGNRGIAILGSDGHEIIDNRGSITGDVQLGLGDDIYRHRSTATFEGNLFLGNGNNTFINDGTFDGLFEVGTGNDIVENNGELAGLSGPVDLGAGDDVYRQSAAGVLPDRIIGGDGDDTIELKANTTSPTRTLDLDDIEGFETIRLTGTALDGLNVSGGWNLDGTEDFTGATEVTANAVLRASGVKTFAGDLSVAAGGGLVLEYDGMAIPLTVEGTTSVEGAGLVVDFEDGTTPTEGAPVQVIDAVGGLEGEFGFFGFFSTPLDGVLTLLHEENAVFVSFDPSLASLASGQNQRAIARYLNEINANETGVGPFQNFIDALYALNLQGADNLNPILNSLSAEGYDAQTSVMAEAGRQVTSLLLDRPRECEAGQLNRFAGNRTLLPCHARKFSPWVAAIGSFRERDGFDNRPKYDANVGGAVFGIDFRPTGDLDLTFAIASQRASVEVNGFGDSDITMTDLAAHAAWTPGPLRLQLVGSWGHGFHESERRINANLNPVTTAVDQRSDTDHDSDRATLAAEAGYLFDVGPVSIEPLLGVDWAWINQRTIDEDEAPFGLALTVPGREDEIGSISAGVRLTADYHHAKFVSDRLIWAEGVWRPMLDLRWRQYLEGEERDFQSEFDGAPRDNRGLQITSEEDPGGLEIGAGLSFIPELATRLQIDFRYDAYISENTLQHDLVGRIAFGF